MDFYSYCTPPFIPDLYPRRDDTNRTNKEAEAFLSKAEAINIRMRGLPYDCTKEQITKFFAEGENGVDVLDGEKGVMFVMKADGKASGDAFVQFATKEDAAKALLKNKESIGTRYIELFQSTPAEVNQVCGKSMEPTKSDVNGFAQTPTGLMGMIPPAVGAAGLQVMSPAALVPQRFMMGGARKDCIRLRGLQYEAKVEHILEFLGEFSKYIVEQGVHMIFNAQGHPSGEAFIQMITEQAAAMAAADRHNKYMQIPGKKQRYIEVFQCSEDDMNLGLTRPATSVGILPSALFPAAAAMAAAQSRPLLSPGGTFLHHHQQQQALAAAGFLPGFSQPALFGTQVPGALQNGTLAAAQAIAACGGMDALASLRLLHGAGGAQFPPGVGFMPTTAVGPGGNPVVYFPYPSPPVSPTSYYAVVAHLQQNPSVVLMRGLPLNATTADVLNLLQGFPEITAESIHFHRTTIGHPTGEAFITFPTRADAERAVMEKRTALANRQIELYHCGF